MLVKTFGGPYPKEFGGRKMSYLPRDLRQKFHDLISDILGM